MWLRFQIVSVTSCNKKKHQRRNWCTQYFRESRIKVKTNICEHNNFLNEDSRWKPTSVNTIFLDLKPKFSCKSTSVNVYCVHRLLCTMIFPLSSLAGLVLIDKKYIYIHSFQRVLCLALMYLIDLIQLCKLFFGVVKLKKVNCCLPCAWMLFALLFITFFCPYLH